MSKAGITADLHAIRRAVGRMCPGAAVTPATLTAWAQIIMDQPGGSHWAFAWEYAAGRARAAGVSDDDVLERMLLAAIDAHPEREAIATDIVARSCTTCHGNGSITVADVRCWHHRDVDLPTACPECGAPVVTHARQTPDPGFGPRPGDPPCPVCKEAANVA